MTDTFWLIAVAALATAACAIPGTFLVLRRMSMMGDAISHAVLPGLAAAFLFTGTRANLTMFLGAAAVGLLTAVLTDTVRRVGRVDEGASMGVVFTSLFALGLVMLERVGHTGAIDIDPSCVLYGQIELVLIDTWTVLGAQVPRAAVVLGAVLLVNAAVVLLMFKEMTVASFDAGLATSLGIPAAAVHYVLMAMTAVTAVAAFNSVGSILVIAMLIAPPAAAYLLTDRLGPMLLAAVGLGVVAAVLGYALAVPVPTWLGLGESQISGGVAVASGLLVGAAALGSPRHGVLARLARRRRLRAQVRREDTLLALLRGEERGRAPGPLHAGTLARLRRRGLVEGRALTDKGRRAARRLLRDHRLWETYLHDRAGVPADHTHATAERLEHVTAGALREELEQNVDAAVDPHGRVIPDGGK